MKLITTLGALAIVSAPIAAHAESLATVLGLHEDCLRYVGSVGGANLVHDVMRPRCRQFGLGASEDLSRVTYFLLDPDGDAAGAMSVKTAPFDRAQLEVPLPPCRPNAPGPVR